MEQENKKKWWKEVNITVLIMFLLKYALKKLKIESIIIDWIDCFLYVWMKYMKCFSGFVLIVDHEMWLGSFRADSNDSRRRVSITWENDYVAELDWKLCEQVL